MARPLRIQFEGAWYHVFNRGAGHRPVFYDDAHRQGFLDLLGEVHDRFGIEIHAFCLMGNHYHLLVRTPFANLAHAMKHLDGVYTQRFNRNVATDGALFRGRYKAPLIDSEMYLLSASRYIHLNPVEAKLVRGPGDYKWSSYRAYVAQAPTPRWLTLVDTLETLGKTADSLAYQEFVEGETKPDVPDLPPEDQFPLVLGSRTFIQDVARRTGIAVEVLRKSDSTQDPPSVEEIVRAVAAEFEVPVNAVLSASKGRRPNVLRLLALHLVREHHGLSLRELASTFGLRSHNAAIKSLRALAQRLAYDQQLQHHLDRIDRMLREGDAPSFVMREIEPRYGTGTEKGDHLGSDPGWSPFHYDERRVRAMTLSSRMGLTPSKMGRTRESRT